MIIFYPSNLLYLCLGIGLLFLIGGSIWYVINDVTSRVPEWREKEITASQRIGLLVMVLLYIASIAAVAYGWIFHNGAAGAIGCIAMLVCSLGCSMLGSPIQLITATDNAGCIGSLFVLPSTVGSLMLSVTCGWIFALVTAFRGSSIKFRVVTILVLILLVASVVGIPLGIGLAQDMQEQNQLQQDQAILNGITEKVKTNLAELSMTPIALTEEETAVMERLEYPSPLDIPESAALVAKAFSECYLRKDFDGILEIVDYLAYHDTIICATVFGDISIWFTEDYLNFLRESAINLGEAKGGSETIAWFTYEGRDITFYKGGVSISNTFKVDGKEYDAHCTFDTEAGREREFADNEKLVRKDYYLVGSTVEKKSG